MILASYLPRSPRVFAGWRYAVLLITKPADNTWAAIDRYTGVSERWLIPGPMYPSADVSPRDCLVNLAAHANVSALPNSLTSARIQHSSIPDAWWTRFCLMKNGRICLNEPQPFVSWPLSQ